jgi:hypothetical protein
VRAGHRLAIRRRTNRPIVSPDGRWLAYASGDFAATQIFVRPYPNTDRARTQVSTDGGSHPLWSRNGRELFYLTLEGALMSVPVIAPRTGASWKTGAPSRVLDASILGSTSPSLRRFDVSPDGQRFLVINDAAGATGSVPARLVVVQNLIAPRPSESR